MHCRPSLQEQREEYGGGEEEENRMGSKGGVRKGYVPMMVGRGKGERFVVHTRLFKHPSFAALLEMAEREFGYEHPGVLRIPCDAKQFRSVVNAASRDKSS